MNKVILMGRLTRDPEPKDAGETKVTRYRLAVDRRFKKDETDWTYLDVPRPDWCPLEEVKEDDCK